MYNGIWAARGHSWRWNDTVPTNMRPVYIGKGVYQPLRVVAAMQWEGVRHVMRGDHPGCIEARDSALTIFKQVFPGVCEFDGRLSLAYSEQLRTYFLYARANLAPSGGSRGVQVSRSHDLVTWSAFQRIRINGHTSGHVRSDGDTYYFLVQPNPVHRGSLVALFPLVQHSRACIGLALSVDGVEWSSVTPLLRCGVHGERAEHQPIGMVALEGWEASLANARHRPPGGPSPKKQAHELNESIVAIYLHERVPEIAFDDTAPHRLFKTHQKLAFERGGAHVVRYLVPCSLLSKWTAEQLAELSGMGRRGARAQSTRSNRLAWRMARETERLTCSASSPSSVSAAACNR